MLRGMEVRDPVVISPFLYSFGFHESACFFLDTPPPATAMKHPGRSSSEESLEPLISVVVVNFNRREDLREAMLSVRRQDYPRVETLVVDNGSSDGSAEMLAEEFPEVELIAVAENLGMAGYSVGFERAAGELVFQMDNDSLIPDSRVLTEVARRFAVGPEELGIVACRVEEYRVGEDDPADLRALDDRVGPLESGGFHAGGVGFRRRHLDAVGGYHRAIFLYGSELFLQMKFLEKGYRIQYFPEILMLHKSSAVARSSAGVYFELRNRYWFMRRFARRSQQLRFLPFMLLYDLVYSLVRNRPGAFLKAVKDGFSPMPEDLGQPLRSNRPRFLRSVEEVGRRFGPLALVRSIGGGIRGQLRP